MEIKIKVENGRTWLSLKATKDEDDGILRMLERCWPEKERDGEVPEGPGCEVGIDITNLVAQCPDLRVSFGPPSNQEETPPSGAGG